MREYSAEDNNEPTHLFHAWWEAEQLTPMEPKWYRYIMHDAIEYMKSLLGNNQGAWNILKMLLEPLILVTFEMTQNYFCALPTYRPG
eukprot:14565891-Ditylum_brightwellii.AAC.1